MRVKRGIVRHRRHKKIRSLAKGFQGMRRTAFRKVNEAVMKSGQHAYRDRRKKKRIFRALWIVRLNAAVRAQGFSYSRFIKSLKDKNVTLDRKVLSEMAIHEPAAFAQLAKEVMGSAK